MNIGIVINTCKNYYKNLSTLIPQLISLPISKNNIIIVSGQEDKESIIYENSIKIIKVQYTGLNLTCAIYLYEHIDEYPDIAYWIMLPDTIEIGPLFFEKIMYYYDLYLKDQSQCSLPFINPSIRPTMDMGFIHRNHFARMGNFLHKIKLQSTEREHLIQLKKQLIYDENVIFGIESVHLGNATVFEYCNSYEKPKYFITNDHVDLTETILENGYINRVYFCLLDLYKYQRNFKGPSFPVILDLDIPLV
jgi:hypothetical protein